MLEFFGRGSAFADDNTCAFNVIREKIKGTDLQIVDIL